MPCGSGPHSTATAPGPPGDKTGLGETILPSIEEWITKREKRICASARPPHGHPGAHPSTFPSPAPGRERQKRGSGRFPERSDPHCPSGRQGDQSGRAGRLHGAAAPERRGPASESISGGAGERGTSE